MCVYPSMRYLIDNDVPDMLHLMVNFAIMYVLLSVEHIVVECQLMDARRTCLKMCKDNRMPKMRELLGNIIRINEIISFLIRILKLMI